MCRGLRLGGWLEGTLQICQLPGNSCQFLTSQASRGGRQPATRVGLLDGAFVVACLI